MEQIAEGRSRVWHSNKPASEQSSKRVAPKKKPARAAAREKRAKRARSRGAQDRKEGDIRRLATPSRTPVRRAALARCRPSSARASPRSRTSAPARADWVHEIKFDGYRIQARIGGGKVELRTRTGLDWTDKFPTIAASAAALKRHDAVLDGEIVSGDAHGVSDFSALQDDLKSGRHDRLVYYVFDLLHLDGYDLTGATLIDRKRDAAGTARASCRTTASCGSASISRPTAPTMLKLGPRDEARRHRVEAPRAHYRSGRVGDWLKIKVLEQPGVRGGGLRAVRRQPEARCARWCSAITTSSASLRRPGRHRLHRQDARRLLEALAAAAHRHAAVRPRAGGRARPRRCIGSSRRWWSRSISAAGPAAGYVRQASFKGVREDKPAQAGDARGRDGADGDQASGGASAGGEEDRRQRRARRR